MKRWLLVVCLILQFGFVGSGMAREGNTHTQRVIRYNTHQPPYEVLKVLDPIEEYYLMTEPTEKWVQHLVRYKEYRNSFDKSLSSVEANFDYPYRIHRTYMIIIYNAEDHKYHKLEVPKAFPAVPKRFVSGRYYTMGYQANNVPDDRRVEDPYEAALADVLSQAKGFWLSQAVNLYHGFEARDRN